jgi:4-aminobutyrate aminotransferase
MNEDELVRQCLYQLELLLQQQTAPQDTAAVLIEPVLGEGGYVVAPPSFLRGLREICDKNGLLLIVDEVQSGFGRTGKNFSIEYSGVRPDIMTMAKVLPSLNQIYELWLTNLPPFIGLGEWVPA